MGRHNHSTTGDYTGLLSKPLSIK